jgi:hypothetical protein
VIRKKSLKIPNVQSESVNQRRTDNIMDKRKRKKGQTTIYKALHRKLMIEQYEPLENGCELTCSGWEINFWSTYVTRRVTLATNLVISDEW